MINEDNGVVISRGYVIEDFVREMDNAIMDLFVCEGIYVNQVLFIYYYLFIYTIIRILIK
jgi:hypothetical protein